MKPAVKQKSASVANKGTPKRGRPMGSKRLPDNMIMVSFQLSPSVKALLDEAAIENDMSLSQLLRELCRKEAERRSKERAT